MKAISIIATTLAIASTVLILSCEYERPGLWELKCAACHDGKTVLNGRTMPDSVQLREKYPNMGAFMNSCQGGPGCMNILKHDKELFRDVGRELGIPE